MARVLGLLPSALRAARAGLSATAWYKTLRVQGIAPRESEARALYAHAVSLVATGGDEVGARQSQKPRIADLAVWPTKNATGVKQTVTLLYRDRTTGQIQQTFWSVVSPKGVIRREAVASAIEAYAGHADAYNQDLIMAVHSSARLLVPTPF